MIRRSITSAAGQPIWQLISQQDHARIAAEIATHWDAGTDWVARQDLLLAIRYHDDGWAAWDELPIIDRGMGRPAAFDEIDAAISNRIWDASITAAEEHGPLVAYIVARHFIRMRAASHAGPESESEFIARNSRRCEQWFESLKTDRRASFERDLMEAAVDLLQFFDMLSLLVCLAGNEAQVQLSPPGEVAFSMNIDHRQQIRFKPNPLRTGRLELRIEACEVPVAVYRNANDLKRAASRREIIWRLDCN